MEFRFVAVLCSNLGNKNSDVGHVKCSRGTHLARGPQVPHPCCMETPTGWRHLLMTFRSADRNAGRKRSIDVPPRPGKNSIFRSLRLSSTSSTGSGDKPRSGKMSQTQRVTCIVVSSLAFCCCICLWKWLQTAPLLENMKSCRINKSLSKGKSKLIVKQERWLKW